MLPGEFLCLRDWFVNGVCSLGPALGPVAIDAMSPGSAVFSHCRNVASMHQSIVVGYRVRLPVCHFSGKNHSGIRGSTAYFVRRRDALYD